jgi:beta-phosphoglucomutase-like phosphatase (HAD superfamily)
VATALLAWFAASVSAPDSARAWPHPDLPQVGLRAVGVAEHDHHRAEAAAGLELPGGQAGHP